MAIYMKLDGAEGGVTTEGYEKWIELESLQFGVGRAISMEPGHVSDREASRPSISEVNIVKRMDNSTSAIFKESVSGAAGKNVEIHFMQTGDNSSLKKYMEYKLENVMVSSYGIGAEKDGGKASENISLSFTKIEMNYTGHDNTNSAQSPMRVGYDLKAAKPL